MSSTANLGLRLVEDADPLRAAVKDAPNENMEALDAEAASARLRAACNARQAAAALNALADLEGAEAATVSFKPNSKQRPNSMPDDVTEGLRVGEVVVISGEVPYLQSGRPFMGWAVGSSTSDEWVVPGGLLYLKAPATSLLAKWGIRFTLHANDGSGATMQQVAATTPGCGFDREGYEFVEWNTEPDGSGRAIAEGGATGMKPTESGIDLYAQWAESESGGLAPSQPRILTVGDLAGLEVRHA